MNAAARIREFRHGLEERFPERRAQSPAGTGLFVDSLPGVYDLNYLRVERPGPAEQVAREADGLMEAFHHTKATTPDGGLAAGLAALGWHVAAHLVMELQREPDRRVDTRFVREVPFDTIVAQRGYDYDDLGLRAMLNEGRRAIGRAVPTRWLAAFADGEPAAYCEVRSRDGVAQIEDVNTLPAFRGRGLGRALVQHAADEARATHDVVFLEALEDDWPRELYAKLGFVEIDRLYHCLLPPSPLVNVRIRTPRLVLRLATVAELRELYRVAEAGIHDPAVMPFEFPWTDMLNETDFLAFHRDTLAAWQPDDWGLNLIAFLDGQPVGTQGVNATDFARTRRVSTGSWLGRAYQGRGLGTEMRSAILSLAFDVLGAQVAVSGALAGNAQSLGVSRRLGYRVTGSHVVSPRGEPVVHTDLQVTRETFRPAVQAVVAGVDRALFGV